MKKGDRREVICLYGEVQAGRGAGTLRYTLEKYRHHCAWAPSSVRYALTGDRHTVYCRFGGTGVQLLLH